MSRRYRSGRVQVEHADPILSVVVADGERRRIILQRQGDTVSVKRNESSEELALNLKEGAEIAEALMELIEWQDNEVSESGHGNERN